MEGLEESRPRFSLKGPYFFYFFFFHLCFSSLGQKEQKNNRTEWTLAMKTLLTAIPERSTCHSLLAKVLRVRQKRENSISNETLGGKEHRKGRRRWKEKKGREGWVVHPRLCSTDC